jgi:signal peptidase II
MVKKSKKKNKKSGKPRRRKARAVKPSAPSIESMGIGFLKKETFHHLFFVVAAVVLFLDQMVKYFATSYMLEGQSIGGKVIGLSLVSNTGTAFGLFGGNNEVFIWLSIFVIGAIIYAYLKYPMEKWASVSLALVLAGAAGNLIDRMMFGYVTDFIRISAWPAFNIADAAITAGVIGLIISLWKK